VIEGARIDHANHFKKPLSSSIWYRCIFRRSKESPNLSWLSGYINIGNRRS
jgi:hypothetical protein